MTTTAATRTLRLLTLAGALLVPGALVAGDAATATWPAPGAPRVIRVAADPNNLPFSNRRGEGFENRLAELIGRALHARIEYVWHAQRRGFVRETVTNGGCDVVLGVPAGYERLATTRPYYRSSYVFVTRADRRLALRSLDDPRLARLTIGIPLVGDDGGDPPPSHALARRGLADRVRGYTVYGDYAAPDPPARLVHAVASGDVDVALAWGPLAGYFARREPVELVVAPVSPAVDDGVAFTYAIAVGVRRDEPALRAAIDRVLETRHAEIARILDDFAVPRVAGPTAD